MKALFPDIQNLFAADEPIAPVREADGPKALPAVRHFLKTEIILYSNNHLSFLPPDTSSPG